MSKRNGLLKNEKCTNFFEWIGWNFIFMYYILFIWYLSIRFDRTKDLFHILYIKKIKKFQIIHLKSSMETNNWNAFALVIFNFGYYQNKYISLDQSKYSIWLNMKFKADIRYEMKNKTEFEKKKIVQRVVVCTGSGLKMNYISNWTWKWIFYQIFVMAQM